MHMLRLLTSTLSAACLLGTHAAAAATLPVGQRYVAPYGDFSCNAGLNSGIEYEHSFNAEGGAARLVIDKRWQIRIDVDKLDTEADPGLIADRERLYDVHLEQRLLPQIQNALPEASLQLKFVTDIDDRAVQMAAVLMPWTDTAGKRQDAMRTLVQYSSGKHMYTIGTYVPAPRPGEAKPIEQLVREAGEQAYRLCTLPR